jgi:hypothetical protein
MMKAIGLSPVFRDLNLANPLAEPAGIIPK